MRAIYNVKTVKTMRLIPTIWPINRNNNNDPYFHDTKPLHWNQIMSKQLNDAYTKCVCVCVVGWNEEGNGILSFRWGKTTRRWNQSNKRFHNRIVKCFLFDKIRLSGSNREGESNQRWKYGYSTLFFLNNTPQSGKRRSAKWVHTTSKSITNVKSILFLNIS